MGDPIPRITFDSSEVLYQAVGARDRLVPSSVACIDARDEAPTPIAVAEIQ
jgi:hypothetical protein